MCFILFFLELGSSVNLGRKDVLLGLGLILEMKDSSHMQVLIYTTWPRTYSRNKRFISYAGTIRLIPQGTVDNNQGPDRLPGPKALDPNYCRQPTLSLHDLCLEVLTVHVTEMRLTEAKAFPLLLLLMSRF